MRRILLVVAALLTTAGSSARAEPISIEFSDVPLGSWQYDAMRQLVRLDGATRPFVDRPLTRYEFAFALARRMEWRPFEQNSKQTEVSAALNREFASEIKRVYERVNAVSDPVVLESPVTIEPLDADTTFSFLLQKPVAVEDSVRAQSREFEDVPAGSWQYSTLAQLIEMGQVEGYKAPFVERPMTRYEFAVALCRWMDHYSEEDLASDKNEKIRDMIGALGYEFAPEIISVSKREVFDKIPLESKIATTSPSDWFDTWHDTMPQIERRIQAPPRIVVPVGFLRRTFYQQPSELPPLRDSVKDGFALDERSYYLRLGVKDAVLRRVNPFLASTPEKPRVFWRPGLGR